MTIPFPYFSCLSYKCSLKISCHAWCRHFNSNGTFDESLNKLFEDLNIKLTAKQTGVFHRSSDSFSIKNKLPIQNCKNRIYQVFIEQDLNRLLGESLPNSHAIVYALLDVSTVDIDLSLFKWKIWRPGTE